jgi:hypothetical protein
MHRLSTHLRGLMVALATLALTAGVAFAARPVGDTGLERATDAAGKVVPVGPGADEPALPEPDDGDEDTDADEPAVDEDLDEDEDADERDGEDGEDADEDADEDDGDRAENHGWFVSEAAKGDTPDTYRNHGEYVSEIARGDDGKPGSVEEADDADQEAGEDSDADEPATTVKATTKDKADRGKSGDAKAGKAKAGKAERSNRGGK